VGVRGDERSRGDGGDGIHETPPETYDTVVKENVLVDSPAGAVPAVAEAIRVAREHPQRPVRVGIPKDALASHAPQPAVGDRKPAVPPAQPASAVDRATDLLAEADAPVILAGGGVRRAGASDSLRTVAERLDAPVVTTHKGKGTLPETHSLSAGVICGGSSVELRELLADADRGLVVGSDLDAVSTASWSVSLPESLIHVTLDGDDIGFGYEADLGIVADADRFLRALGDRLEGLDATDGSAGSSSQTTGAARAETVRSADRERFDAVAAGRAPGDPLSSVEVLREVREALPTDAVVTADAGGSRQWILVSFPATGPSRYVNRGRGRRWGPRSRRRSAPRSRTATATWWRSPATEASSCVFTSYIRWRLKVST